MKPKNETDAGESAGLDVERIRRDFPILRQRIRGKPLVYLDNTASAQKPKAVVEAIQAFYLNDYANVHRGVHYLSQRATDMYEEAREKARRFLNAADRREIVFVRGATEGINLVAWAFGGVQVQAGDEIVISALEHHSNIVPWHFLRERKGPVATKVLGDIAEVDYLEESRVRIRDDLRGFCP